MKHKTVLCIPRSEATRRAGDYLSEMGLHVTRKGAPDVTHILLPVPSFPTGDEYLAHILADVPEDVIISGGNLSSSLLHNYATVDFLKDPYYLAQNAAITASCTKKIVTQKIDTAHNCRILILGWGRIGKCLCRLFEKDGADITVAVRKDSDRAMISALGCRGISIADAVCESERFDVIINTVPEMLLPNIRTKKNAILLELASKPGMSGENIINCRGLPGKMAPIESGKLIAATFIRLCLGSEE